MTKQLPEALRQSIAAYIDTHYVEPVRFAAPTVRKAMRAADWEETTCESRAPMPMAMPSKAAPQPSSLQEMLRQADAGFSETLLKLIDKTGKKDSEIYKKANISKQHFSKIRNNPDYKPTKATALAFAIALELNLEQTKDLIGRAGYALTNSSKFDLIIRFYIEQGMYDILQINLSLYEFDQPILGA